MRSVIVLIVFICSTGVLFAAAIEQNWLMLAIAALVALIDAALVIDE